MIQRRRFLQTVAAGAAAIGMLRGVRAEVQTEARGRLSTAVYGTSARADRMREAVRGKVDADEFVQGVCGAPEFNAPGISTERQAFCILMEAAGAG